MTGEPFGDIAAAARQRLHDEVNLQLDGVMRAHAQALDAARSGADMAAEERWSGVLADARRQMQQDIEAAVSSAREEFDAQRTQSQSLGADLIQALSTLDRATTLTQTLHAIREAARSHAAQVELWLLRGTEFTELEPGAPAAETDWSLIKEAADRRVTTSRDGLFASPLLLDGTPVAVLHARGVVTDGPLSGDEALALIVRAGASRLACLTAMRLSQAQRWMSSRAEPTPRGSPASQEQAARIEDEAGARRFVRLLISEIRMYNDATVRAGREHRDLLNRLRPEIDRVRRLYDARVAASLPMRDRYFDEELVRTLADGDRTLLG